MSELEKAIKAIEPLFAPDRYPSYRQEWDLIVSAARAYESKVDSETSVGVDSEYFARMRCPEC